MVCVAGSTEVYSYAYWPSSIENCFFSARVLILIDLSCKIKEELVDGTMVRFFFPEKNKDNYSDKDSFEQKVQ